MEVLHETKAIPTLLQGADGLLKGLFICFADTHDLTDGAHLGAKFILGAGELLEIPAGEFDYYIIAPGYIFIESAFTPVRNFVKGEAAGKK